MVNTTQVYAMPNVTATDGLLGWMSYINNVADGFFFPMIMMVVLTVLTIIFMNREPFYKATMYSSFVCFVLSGILAVLDLIAPSFVYTMIIILGISVAWTAMTRD